MMAFGVQQPLRERFVSRVDNDDLLALSQALTGSGTPPASLRVTGLGNPYFFTGRRLHLLEDVALEGVNPNRQLQYNRARHYHPVYGRWLQRDPTGYIDGMNLYEYVRSGPATARDPSGKTSRSWIPSRLIYTCNCGWIDWSHANGGKSSALLADIRAA